MEFGAENCVPCVVKMIHSALNVFFVICLRILIGNRCSKFISKMMFLLAWRILNLTHFIFHNCLAIITTFVRFGEGLENNDLGSKNMLLRMSKSKREGWCITWSDGGLGGSNLWGARAVLLERNFQLTIPAWRPSLTLCSSNEHHSSVIKSNSHVFFFFFFFFFCCCCYSCCCCCWCCYFILSTIFSLLARFILFSFLLPFSFSFTHRFLGFLTSYPSLLLLPHLAYVTNSFALGYILTSIKKENFMYMPSVGACVS